MHQSRRWDTDLLALRRVVDNGDIGEVFNIETFVGGFEHPCRAWHSEESISGGAVYDWGSHHVDWIHQLLRLQPARVLCTTHTRVWHDTTNVDQLTLWMQWDDGREATFRQSDVCAIRRPKFHVEGTAGHDRRPLRPLRTDRVVPGRGHVEQTSRTTPKRPSTSPSPVRRQTTARRPQPFARPPTRAGASTATSPITSCSANRSRSGPKQSRDVVAVLEAGHRSGAKGGTLIELWVSTEIRSGTAPSASA